MNVSIVTYLKNGGISVDQRSFQGEILISGSELGGADVEKIVLVISGTTPFTREKAIYSIDLE